MHLSPNRQSLFFLRKQNELQTNDSRRSDNDFSRIRRYSEMFRALSRYALQHNLMIIAYYIARLYFLTIRIQSVNEETVRENLKNGNKLIAALWHQRIIAVIGYAKRFGVYRPSVMISSSRDGDLIADVFSRMNFRPVRGSSSRNGKQALLAMVDDLKRNSFAVHILDGPKGPKGVIKPGLLVMARQSGAPVIPVYATVSRAWILRSWDNCMIPKPFSKIVIRWDQPIAIPGEMDERKFEDTRQALEEYMLENQRREDRDCGWKNLI
jgi:hypothetical protein